jgi:hypothetical protein
MSNEKAEKEVANYAWEMAVLQIDAWAEPKD